MNFHHILCLKIKDDSNDYMGYIGEKRLVEIIHTERLYIPRKMFMLIHL